MEEVMQVNAQTVSISEYTKGTWVPELSYKNPNGEKIVKQTLSDASGTYTVIGNICHFTAQGTISSVASPDIARYFPSRIYMTLPISGKVGENVGNAVWKYANEWHYSAHEIVPTNVESSNQCEIYCASTKNMMILKSMYGNITCYTNGAKFSVSGWYFIN